MTREQFCTALTKYWRLIVICFLAAGAGAAIGSKLIVPLYQSTVLVQVALGSGNSVLNYDSLLASGQLIQTEAQLATSDLVLHEVASHYPGLTVEQLSKEVSSTAKTNTQLFEIDVSDPSPTQAANIANDIATILINPQLQQAQRVLSQTLQQIHQQLDTTRQQINAIVVELAKLQTNGGNQVQVYTLQAQVSSLQQQYSQWQLTLAQFEWTNAINANFLRVVQPAQAGASPVSPHIFLNIGIGLVVGLSLGVLLALMLEQFDTHVNTLEDLSLLMNWPVLATIWQARSSKKDDVFNLAGDNSNIEPYNILRTNIGLSGIDKPLHYLMVTSAAPREGKSIIAANLAIFMAKTGKTILLIDANLRHSTLNELFDLPKDQMGFSNALLAIRRSREPDPSPHRLDAPSASSIDSSEPGTPSGQLLHAITSQPEEVVTATNVSLEPFVHLVSIPNLWVMPSGPLPPNPPELLDSKAMQHLLKLIANCGAEIVIFDAPPMVGLSDASILATKVDSVLVVVDTMHTTKNMLKQLKMILSQTGVHVLGCVANRLPYKRKNSTYYYYTENQNSRDKSVKNVNFLSIPITSLSDEIRFGQKIYSNSNVNHQEIELKNRPIRPDEY